MRKIFLTLLSTLFIYTSVFAQDTRVVFVSSSNPSGLLQVFTMNLDGSDKKQLTNVPFNCMFPRWSKDGSQIVFRTDDRRIYLIEDASSSMIVNPYFVFSGDNPIFSASGEEIIFNGDHEYLTSIYVMLPTDPEAEMMTDIDFSTQQVLSNDGRYLVFSGFEDGSKCIFLMDLYDTTDYYITRISINKNANLEPDISSDNQKFVYASFDNNLKGTIYLNDNGTERSLTQGMPSSSQPKFSPDDNLIGFVTIENSGIHLNTMSTDGSNKNKFNVRGGSVGTFRWIDSDRIIYDAESSNQYSIGILNVKSGDNSIIASGGLNLHPDVLSK